MACFVLRRLLRLTSERPRFEPRLGFFLRPMIESDSLQALPLGKRPRKLYHRGVERGILFRSSASFRIGRQYHDRDCVRQYNRTIAMLMSATRAPAAGGLHGGMLTRSAFTAATHARTAQHKLTQRCRAPRAGSLQEVATRSTRCTCHTRVTHGSVAQVEEVVFYPFFVYGHTTTSKFVRLAVTSSSSESC